MSRGLGDVYKRQSYALFKGNQLVHFIPREHIEGRDINDIAMDIKDAFDTHCDA